MGVDLPRCAGGDIRPASHGTGAIEPVPRRHDGAGRAAARSPRSGVPRRARRHQRSPPHRVRDVQRVDLAHQRHGFGRDGGLVRQFRPTGSDGGRRRQRRLRRADVRGGGPPRRRGGPGGRRMGRAHRSRSPARRPSVAGDHRGGPRRDLDGGAQRHRAARGRQGRRAPAGGHGDLPGRDRGRGRRLGRGHRLQRHAEMPGRPTRALAADGLRSGAAPPRGAALQLVPRPQSPVALRPGHLRQRAGVPPHGAGGDDRGPARRPRNDFGRGHRGGAATTCRMRAVAPGRTGGPRPRAARRRRPSTAAAHHGPRPLRRRRGPLPPGAPGWVRDRDRGRRGPAGRADLADRLHGTCGPGAGTCSRCSAPWRRCWRDERGQGVAPRAAGAARPEGAPALVDRGRLPLLARGAHPLRRLAAALGATAQGRPGALRGPPQLRGPLRHPRARTAPRHRLRVRRVRRASVSRAR